MQLRLTDWVFAFVHGFRYEAEKLTQDEAKCLEPYIEEQMLTKPCQVEVIQFNKPYRLALVFFFNKAKRDLLIHVCQEKWYNLDAMVKKLLDKHRELQLNYEDLHRLLESCRSYPDTSIYAIDFITHVCCICFTRDVRMKGSVFPWRLDYITGAQAIAETVFHLNLCQAQDEFMHACNKTFFT